MVFLRICGMAIARTFLMTVSRKHYKRVGHYKVHVPPYHVLRKASTHLVVFLMHTLFHSWMSSTRLRRCTTNIPIWPA